MLLRSTRYAFAIDRPRRRTPLPVVLSVLLHLLIGALLLVRIRSDFARVLNMGPDLLGARGGGGGGSGRVAYITLPAPPPRAPVAVEVVPPPSVKPPPAPVTPPTTPPPTISPPDSEPTVAAAAPAHAAAGRDTLSGTGPGQGGGTGGGTGGGVGPGTGPGIGPGTGGGEGGRGRRPEPRHLILPPEDPPKELRGVDIQVTFWIDTTGRVERVSFEPPVHDRKFANKLAEAMRNYRFHPAVGPDGMPIAATYTHTLTY